MKYESIWIGGTGSRLFLGVFERLYLRFLRRLYLYTCSAAGADPTNHHHLLNLGLLHLRPSASSRSESVHWCGER